MLRKGLCYVCHASNGIVPLAVNIDSSRRALNQRNAFPWSPCGRARVYIRGLHYTERSHRLSVRYPVCHSPVIWTGDHPTKKLLKLSNQLHTMASGILAASLLAGVAYATALPSHDVQVSYGPRSPTDSGLLSPRGIEARSDHNKTFDIGWQVQNQPLFSA